MPDFSRWLASSDGIDGASRAVDAWNRINRNPAQITLIRQETMVAAQTVRIEHDNTASQSTTKSGGIISERMLTVFGVVNHPDLSIANTDMQRGDEFEHNGRSYRVVDVIQVPGEIQARCAVVS